MTEGIQTQLLVLLSGKQGAGKSSLAYELWTRIRHEHLAYTFPMKFAGPLYEMHEAIMEVMKQYLPADHKMFRKIDGTLLQLLAEEWARQHHGRDIWVEILRNRLAKEGARVRGHNMVVLVDDVRYPNEFDIDWPHKLTIRLNADRDLRKARCEKWRDHETHASEVALDGYDEQGRFDLYLDTGVMGIKACADLAMSFIRRELGVETPVSVEG